MPHKVKRAISLLEYSGFLYAKSVVKIAQRRQAPRYALHLGVAANEKIFHSSFSRDPDRAIKILSIADYREFYSKDIRFNQLVEDHQEIEYCPKQHQRQTEGSFCPICGEKFQTRNVLNKLLENNIEKLALTTFLKNKLKTDLNVNYIRDVLALTETDIQQAHLIGPVRARIIINAAEEYITG